MNLKLFNPAAPPTIRHTIGIAAGKGGVGKSSVTVLLANAFKALGYKVGILDADIYGPSLKKMMKPEKMPEQKGEFILPAISQGIPYISMAFFRPEGQAAAVRAPIATKMITQFIKGTDFGDLDILLVDFPPGTGDIHITLCQQAAMTGALVVTTPQEVSLIDVRKCIHMFKEVRVEVLGVLENMSYFQPKDSSQKHYLFGKEGGKKIASEYNVPFLGEVPIEPELGKALDLGCQLFKDEQLPELQEAFLKLAKNLFDAAEDVKYKNAKVLKEFELVWRGM